jgi:hypothetical protein
MGRLIRSWELLEARGVRIREKFPLLEETAINGQAARPRWAHADG